MSQTRSTNSRSVTGADVVFAGVFGKV